MPGNPDSTQTSFCEAAKCRHPGCEKHIYTGRFCQQHQIEHGRPPYGFGKPITDGCCARMKSVNGQKLRWHRQKCGDGATVYEADIPGWADGVCIEYHPSFDRRKPWSVWGPDGLVLGRFKTRAEAERIAKAKSLNLVREHIATLRVAVRMLK